MTRALSFPLFAVALAAQEPVALSVVPPTIELDQARDLQRVAALGTTESGVTVDLTTAAHWRLEGDAAALQIGGTPTLTPLADGDAVLVAEANGLVARAQVHVAHAAAAPPVSFANEVLPVLTRAGCNAGSCHGAAAGKNGFSLSLFAYDPAHDHAVLTRQLRGRRIDPAAPERSLVLQKAAALVPHTGGVRLPADGPGYATVRDWIAAGAADDEANAPALQGIEVLPAEAVLLAGSQVPMQVRARYRDGSDRDVTALALWSSGNDGAAAVDPEGHVRAVAAGEAAVLARYGGFAVAAPVLVLPDDTPPAWRAPATTPDEFVDAAIEAKLQRARVVPAPLCDDATFARRVHLDLLGRLPTAQEIDGFTADPAPDRRARLVAALLDQPEFAAVSAMAWAEVLRVDGERMEPKGAAQLAGWLREQFAAHRPLDAVVRDLLLGSGPTFASAPANFWLAADQPNLLAEHTAQVFLGIRVQCAQCHNHPFENWTMDDYYGFASFFGQVARKRGEDGAEWIVWDRGSGEVRNKRDGRVVPPRFLGGGAATVPAGADRRAVLAEWLVRSPAFARNVANRLWARLLGRGLVEPADDVRVSNLASHPALLQQLADHLVADHFDVRPLCAAICTSRTYQRAAAPTPLPPALFAGVFVRRLPAEALLDAIAAVTGVPTQYPGVPLGGGAAAIASGRTPLRFLELFGRPTRDGSCVCDRRDEPTLGQALHLVNGDTLAQKLAEPRGRLRTALAANTPPETMLDDLWLAAYSRRATTTERERLLPGLRAAATPAAKLAAWQDVYWAVLNSREFLFQH